MWKSLSIARKICVCVAAMVLGYAIAMSFVIIQGARSEKSLSALKTSLFPAAQQSQTALTAFEQQVKSYGDAVIIGDQNGLQAGKEKGMEAQNALTSIEQNGGLNPELTILVKECMDALRSYSDSAHPVYASMTNGQMDQASKAMDLGKQAEALKIKMKTLTQTLSYNLSEDLSSIAQTSKNQIKASIVALVWVLITSAVLVYLTIIIVRPLGMITNVANRISEGDVNQTVDHESGDEVGMLAEAFRTLIAYIKGVAEAADHLSKGNIRVHMEAHSEQDLLTRNFQKVADTLSKMTTETARLTKAAQEGRLDVRGDTSQLQGAYSEIIDGFNNTLDAVVAPINEAASVLKQMANRDLTGRMTGNYQGDFASIKEGLNQALVNLEMSIQQVAGGSEQVAAASGQISRESQTLAQGSSNQAASLEELSSSIQETAAMARQNASNADQSRSMVEQARKDAALGTENMRRLSEAIQKIKQSADQSAKIVKTINEIAFQTNLLALNAAVEAARAGDLGKGFAVVAEEVRSLALRSAEAAAGTGELIEESVKNSDNGVILNREVLANLDTINEQVNKVSKVIDDIAAASEQQNTSLSTISNTVTQMNNLTQEVAATAQLSASAAQELSGQAGEMQNMVQSFKIKKDAGFSAMKMNMAPQKRTSLPIMAMSQKVKATPSASRMIPFDGDADVAF
jgi:methyl-accepting chemotaxis protein